MLFLFEKFKINYLKSSLFTAFGLSFCFNFGIGTLISISCSKINHHLRITITEYKYIFSKFASVSNIPKATYNIY